MKRQIRPNGVIGMITIAGTYVPEAIDVSLVALDINNIILGRHKGFCTDEDSNCQRLYVWLDQVLRILHEHRTALLQKDRKPGHATSATPDYLEILRDTFGINWSEHPITKVSEAITLVLEMLVPHIRTLQSVLYDPELAAIMRNIAPEELKTLMNFCTELSRACGVTGYDSFVRRLAA